MGKSDKIVLSKVEGVKKIYHTLPVNEVQSDLPLYNNSGDDFIYEVNEMDIPDDFESKVTKHGDNFIIVNSLEEETTPSSSTRPTSSSSSSSDETPSPSSSSSSSDIKTTTSSSSSFQEISTNRNQVNEAPTDKLPETSDKSDEGVIVGLGMLMLGGVLYFSKKH